jgi:hypothetical protein
MLVTKTRYESEQKNTEYELKRLSERYWELSRKYDLLLNYLGLVEHHVQSKYELRPKGDA